MNQEIARILEPSHYQTFDFLGDNRRDSDSAAKYIASRLEEMDLVGKSILDVGCNAGYFLFRLRDKNPDFMLGIDTGQKFINVAEAINATIYQDKSIKFVCGDFFNSSWLHFDLIICFSTFHYFGNQQGKFFDDCFGRLLPGGVLLLEVEEYPDGNTPMVHNAVRPADRKLYPYPNQAQLATWTEGKFIAVDHYPSVKQGGTLYDRFFWHFKRI